MSQSSGKKNSILIVDDEMEYCDLLAELVRRMGYGSVAVNDGISALEAIDREEFSLALIDYHMPGMTGAELLKRIRKKKIRMPVVIITGLEDKEMEEKLRKLEVAIILKKPLQIEQLEMTINQWVKDS